MFVDLRALSEPLPPAFAAELYAKTHTGLPDDIDFYLRACHDARFILELGCGYGRVSGALARAGFDVVGLEIDQPLIDYGRNNNKFGTASVVQGDMRAFELGRRFDRIVIPYSGVYCLENEEAWVSSMKCVASHLNESGMLIFDAWAADAFHNDADPTAQDDQDAIMTIRTSRGVFDVFETTTCDRSKQAIRASYTYKNHSSHEEISARVDHRYVLSEQISALLAKADLTPLVVHGGFDQHVFDDQSELIVVTAVPAGLPR